MEMKQCLVSRPRPALEGTPCWWELALPGWCVWFFFYCFPPLVLPPCSKPNRKRGDSQDHTAHFIAMLFSIWKISLQNALEVLKK